MMMFFMAALKKSMYTNNTPILTAQSEGAFSGRIKIRSEKVDTSKNDLPHTQTAELKSLAAEPRATSRELEINKSRAA
jgi:hypothetical protein